MPYVAARCVPQKKMALFHQITGGFRGVIEAMREKVGEIVEIGRAS